MFPEISSQEIPAINSDQMIEVDRAMVEDYYIQLMQMMENAGRGGNGGGALVAARRLSNCCTFIACQPCLCPQWHR